MIKNWKKNTAIFLGSQMISLFGSALVQYAITWHITLTTQSGFYMMLSIVCGFVPTFLLSPFAGVWADRYNRKVMVMISDGSIAVTTLILALTIWAGYDAIWPLFVALGIRALGSAVQMPCVGAILPSIVPAEHLTKVNGINGSLQSVITLLSPMLSAVLLNTAPFFSIFFVDVATAGLAIVILLFGFRLPERERRTEVERHDYIGELKEGLGYIGKTRYLKHFFIFLSFFYVSVGPVGFLTPLQVTRNYGDNATFLMAVEVAFSVGMIFGGLLIAAWGGFRNKIHSIALGIFAMAACTVLLGIHIPFWTYLVFMGVVGLSMPICNTPSMVLLQENVDPDYMGRVFGIMTMISTSIMPLSMLIFGPLADVIAIEWLLLGTGALMLVLSVLFLENRTLLKAGDIQRETA